MITKFTMGRVAIELAEKMFNEKLASLDIVLEDSLNKAFADERISKDRQDRIVTKFCVALLDNK